MKITRKRYIITRNNRKEIFCGLARNYTFKDLNNLGNIAIKTYQNEKTARSSFERSWGNYDFEIEILEVEETYENKDN